MPAADGTPCPMHRGRTGKTAPLQNATTEHRHERAPAASVCRLTSTCDGPLASIFTVLSTYGVLPEATTAALSMDRGNAVEIVRDDVTGRFQPPDPPPPRA
jgi:hypothetical protein